MARKYEENTYTDERGKFAPGNPGKPKGARHKTTLAISELLQGEAEGLTRKAVDLALDGNTTALRLCLERVVPTRKDSPVQFDLPPMKSAKDAVVAAQAVLQAVSDGEITPIEGTEVMGLVETYRRTLETSDIEDRIAALEAQNEV